MERADGETDGDGQAPFGSLAPDSADQMERMARLKQRVRSDMIRRGTEACAYCGYTAPTNDVAFIPCHRCGARACIGCSTRVGSDPPGGEITCGRCIAAASEGDPVADDDMPELIDEEI